MNLDELVKTFIRRYELDTTKNSYNNDLKTYFGFLVDYKVKTIKIKYDTASLYKDYLKDKYKSNATISRKIAVVSTFYKFLLALGKVKVNPFLGVKKPKVDTTSKMELISEVNVKKIFDYLSLGSKRDEIIFYFLAYHGMRASEISNLKTDDVFLDSETPHIKIIGKGEKVRYHPIIKGMLDRMKEYLASISGSEYMFIVDRTKNKISRIYLWRLVKKITKKLGIENVKTHSFRHFSITRMINKNISLEDVKQFAGHSSITTTDRYYRGGKSINESALKNIDLI